MILKLWQTKQVAPQEDTVKKSIATVLSCGAFFNSIHSPQYRRDGQNNKSLRVYPPGESRPSQSGEEKWSATSY